MKFLLISAAVFSIAYCILPSRSWFNSEPELMAISPLNCFVERNALQSLVGTTVVHATGIEGYVYDYSFQNNKPMLHVRIKNNLDSLDDKSWYLFETNKNW